MTEVQEYEKPSTPATDGDRQETWPIPQNSRRIRLARPSFCRTLLELCLPPGSMLPSPGPRLPVHRHSAHLLRPTPLSHVGDPGLAVTRGSGEAQLLACCVTLGKCQPLPPDLLASEGGSLDHVISELGAKSHGQLLAVNTLVGRAVGKGRMRAVGRRRP